MQMSDFLSKPATNFVVSEGHKILMTFGRAPGQFANMRVSSSFKFQARALLRPSCMSLDGPLPSATYSVIPRLSKRIIAATARLLRRIPMGAFVRSNNLTAIPLGEQEQDALMSNGLLHTRQGLSLNTYGNMMIAGICWL
jgi:hypothetical protein